MNIEYQNKLYDVEIIRKNNKNIYIRVKNNKVIITCNYLTSNKTIKKLINENYNSIIKMIDKMESKTERQTKFYLFGKYYNIIFKEDVKIEIEEDTIYAKDEKTLNKWLSNYIKNTFSNHLKYWYDLYQSILHILHSLRV